MEVILREDFPSLGYVGDRVGVKRGYARNFLLPRGIAVEVTSSNARLLKHKLEEVAARKRRKKAEAEEFSKRFLGLTLQFSLKANQHGRVFGAVSAKDLEDGLAQKGIEIDRKQLKLSDSLRSGGTHEVFIKLHSEVVVPFKVAIEVLKPERKEVAPKKGSRKRAGGREESEGLEHLDPSELESMEDDDSGEIES
jgi:large subunit ribosomal protein L9